MKKECDYDGPCYAARDIRDGNTVLVGGTFPGTLNLSVRVDLEAFEPCLQKIQTVWEGKRDRIGECGAWLKEIGSNADPTLFMALHVVQAVIAKEYPGISDNMNQRGDFYSGSQTPALSDIIQNRSAQCAEIALLAHAALNRLGIENSYVVGAAAWSPDDDCPEAHSFIKIPVRDGALTIYDPTNPVHSNAGTFPALYIADKAQARDWQALAECTTSLMLLQNVLSKKEAFFGVHDGTCLESLAAFTVDPGGKTRQGTARPAKPKPTASP